MKNSTLFCIVSTLLLTSCAGSKLHLYNTGKADVEVEMWKLTKHKREWWYLTGWLEDSIGNLYFHQFTVFHGRRLGLGAYFSHIAFSNYTADYHHFNETLCWRNSRGMANDSMVWIDNDSLTIRPNGMYLHTNDITHDLELRLQKQKNLIGHGKEGLVFMGEYGRRKQRSAYYSYTDLKAEGTLKLNDEEIPVTGNFWFDRQYGNYNQQYWNWYSLRMFNGEEYMLFYFPETKYMIADHITKSGNVEDIDSVEIVHLDSASIKGYHFPVQTSIRIANNETWYIRALRKDEVSSNRIGPVYWEGLCGVFNADDVQLGWAVVELTTK